jgi:hypothetical protein
MTIQAFIDESGGKGQSRVFTMAGWLSTSERWLKFFEEWSACLNRYPHLNYFKMREAASLIGQFRNVPPPVRDSKLRELARIIRNHVAVAFHCTLDLEGFADTIADLGKPFCDPYFWPFHITVMALCFESIDRGCNTQTEVVFDEHSIFKPRAVPWYPVVRAFMNEPSEAAVMPLRPIFSTDAESPPLQAADMLAWLIRRSMNQHWSLIEEWERTGELDVSQPDSPNNFGWLVEEELRFVELSAHCQFLTRQRLEGIVNLMNQHLLTDFKNVQLPPGINLLVRELMNRSSAKC